MDAKVAAAIKRNVGKNMVAAPQTNPGTPDVIANIALTLTTCMREMSDLRNSNSQMAGLVMQLVNGYNNLITQLQAAGLIAKAEAAPPVTADNGTAPSTTAA